MVAFTAIGKTQKVKQRNALEQALAMINKAMLERLLFALIRLVHAFICSKNKVKCFKNEFLPKYVALKKLMQPIGTQSIYFSTNLSFYNKKSGAAPFRHLLLSKDFCIVSKNQLIKIGNFRSQRPEINQSNNNKIIF